MARWETFHHVHIIGRVLRRMPACSSLAQAESAPGSPGWHVVDAHLQWLLPALMQLTCCLRCVWSAEVMLWPTLFSMVPIVLTGSRFIVTTEPCPFCVLLGKQIAEASLIFNYRGK